MIRTPLVLRLALATLPRRFRARYAGDMAELFAYRYVDACQQGPGLAARLTLRSTVDVLRTAFAEHRRPSFFSNNFDSEPPRSGDSPMRTLLYDLRHVFRGVLKRPLFSGLVVGTLALGIGANTAIFTVVNGVLLQPLPYAEPDQLLRVLGKFEPESGFDFARFPLSVPEYVDYGDQATSIASIALYSAQGVSITGDGTAAERTISGVITPSAFDVLGVSAEIGRVFVTEDGLPGAAPVTLLRHGYWQTRYAGDPDILGKEIVVNGVPHTIVGVMAEWFAFPDPRVKLWRPLSVDPAAPGNRKAHSSSAIARLADGATLESASAEVDTLMAAWAEEFPDTHVGHYLYLRPLLQDTVRNVRPALLVLLAASGFVLLIVCANVASILLARGEERTREMAIRSAVGAQRLRLAQLVLGESLVLAGLGGIAGVGLAWLGVRVLIDLQAAAIPRAAAVGLDTTVLGFALATTLVTTLSFSLAPAFHASSMAPRQHLLEGDVRTSASGRKLMLRRALVTAEVALAFVLVMGAGLMIRSFAELTSTDPGFRSEGVLVAGVSLPSSDYPEDGDVIAFMREFGRRAEGLPGVQSAAVSAAVPMYYGLGTWDFEVDGKDYLVDNELAYNGSFSPVQPGFLKLIGARLQSGRMFDSTDSAESQTVTVVNEEFVRRYFPDEEPLGQRVRVKGDPDDPYDWMTVVGVIGDMRDNRLADTASPAYYSPLAQSSRTAGYVSRFTALAVRTDGDPAQLVQGVRRLLSEMDASLPLIAPQTMQEVVDDTVAQPRFATKILTLFAVIALVLGASGIYGVLAYSIAQRTREIGIRKALGARPDQVVSMVVRQGMVPVIAGLALGGLGAIGVGRAMTSLLYGVSPLDPTTYGAVAATLALVAVVACVAPALRAVRLDPLEALRSD